MKKITLLFIIICLPAWIIAQKTEFTVQDVLNVESFSTSDITDNGRFVAGIVRARKDRLNIDHSRYGDPDYVAPYMGEALIISTEDGAVNHIFDEKKILKGLSWSPDDNSLAILVYEDDKMRLYIYDQARSKTRKVKLKTDLALSSGSLLEWTTDGKNIIISLRSAEWAEKGDSLFKEATAGPVTVYDSKKPFLKWDKIQDHSSLAIPAMVDAGSGSVKTLLPEGRYTNISLPEEGNKMVFVKYNPLKTTYDRSGGTEYGLYMIDLDKPEAADTLEAKTEKRINISWDEPKTRYAYSDSGHVFVRSIFEDDVVKISSDTSAVVKKDTSELKFSVMRWSPDGNYVLASAKNGYWMIDAGSGGMELVYDLPEDEEESPRLRIVGWKPDGSSWYMSYSARDRWERGLVEYDLVTRQFADLVKDSRLYSSWEMSEDGSRLFYNLSDGDSPSDLYVADPDFSDTRQLTDLNPWTDNKKMTRSELVEYLDADGNELYGILYYPVDYEPGKKYPLVCEIYENFFNNGYSYSMNLIANAGYFGFKPSVNLIEGYPGEAWVKGITSGINKLIERGLVDKDKLGVHGTSYGGYAASLLITQTDRFAAAINISGKVNIISFLGDSPRIGTRNYAAAEVGQDRIGESLWDAPMKYFATSAVLHADRIETPHLLMSGEGDWNVPALNTRELYYAMRRLDKEVVWVNYVNGGHGAGMASNEADFHDHWERMIDWYRTHFNKEK
ncbi:MAG: prolyl oligopeptidase family serine peptidase [Bacteroidales bacterium]|nr:prolyl oligopeptidase family serine peptidase [Bacteroidales bacterium]